MNAGLETAVLKGVSRSFYLSLRLLPGPMRRPAGIAYLLARTSDTIADSAGVPADIRLQALDDFEAAVNSNQKPKPWASALLAGISDPREKLLMLSFADIHSAFSELSGAEIELVREVVGIITGGQRLDLQRFGNATEKHPIALANEAELTDYTWRVAGCVGVFWTKLGYETLGSRFSKYPAEDLLQHATKYGKALQLVNVLRDLPADLGAGRCYLPVEDLSDREALLLHFEKWRQLALDWLAEGFFYSKKLRSRRLRVASVLPAMIARETLEMMAGLDFPQLAAGVKIPRKRVYRLLIEALFSGN